MRIFPPFTATADAHEQFRGYATSILEGMLQKGELNDSTTSDAEKTNVSSMEEVSVTRIVD